MPWCLSIDCHQPMIDPCESIHLLLDCRHWIWNGISVTTEKHRRRKTYNAAYKEISRLGLSEPAVVSACGYASHKTHALPGVYGQVHLVMYTCFQTEMSSDQSMDCDRKKHRAEGHNAVFGSFLASVSFH